MRISILKSSTDNKSFKLFEVLGAEICMIDDLDKTDDKIKDLIRKDYRTIIMTDEVASFSESIIKKYKNMSDIKIVIYPHAE